MSSSASVFTALQCCQSLAKVATVTRESERVVLASSWLQCCGHSTFCTEPLLRLFFNRPGGLVNAFVRGCGSLILGNVQGDNDLLLALCRRRELFLVLEG